LYGWNTLGAVIGAVLGESFEYECANPGQKENSGENSNGSARTTGLRLRL